MGTGIATSYSDLDRGRSRLVVVGMRQRGRSMTAHGDVMETRFRTKRDGTVRRYEYGLAY
jgi:hypothetical protein